MFRISVLRVASALGIAAACVFGTPASATTLVGNGYANGSETFTLSAPFPPAVNPVGAGAFTGTFGGVPIIFWCAELTQTFSFGTSYDYTASLLNNSALSRLFTEVSSAARLSTPDTSAAFQLAIWEILFESQSPYNISNGNFKVTDDHGNAAAIALANGWLANLNNFQPLNQVFLLHSDTNQDFITDTPIPPRLIVPEPSSLPLLGIGLLAIAFGLRRRTLQQLH